MRDTATVLLPDLATLPRVVVLDLDGTLLDPASALRARSRAAVEWLLDRDVPVVIATARPLRSVRALIGADLVERVGLIHMNGAAVSHLGVMSSTAERLSVEAAARVLAVATALAPNARVVCEMDGETFGCDVSLDADALWTTNAATPDMVVPLAEAFARGAAKIAINGFEESLAALVAQLRHELSDHIDVIADGSGSFANIVPRGISKQAALARLFEAADPWAGSLAFGDDLSDIEVLRCADYGVAMANAHPDVLEAARYRTYSNAEDGVAHVIERLAARIG